MWNIGQRTAKLVLWASLTLSTACAPEPKYARCQNDAECREQTDGEYEHCVQSRCVECVSGARMCPERQSCVAGRCAER